MLFSSNSKTFSNNGRKSYFSLEEMFTDELLIKFFAIVDTGEKVGVQWDSKSAIYRLQESL
jgi:hypothetical protein